VSPDTARRLQIAQESAADELLSTDPFALLTGMLLDQQFPMERAFAGPATIQERLGSFDAQTIAAADPEEFAALCARRPAVHRYPGAMARRIQGLAAEVVATYDGDAAALWRTATTGEELLRRLRALPGFGERKAQIFTALLGKQLGVRPPGWREAAGPYGADGAYNSVADVVDAASLAKVRERKQQAKAAARASG